MKNQSSLEYYDWTLTGESSTYWRSDLREGSENEVSSCAGFYKE